MAGNNKVYGTQEAARTLGVSVRTVQLWVEKGLLEAWKTAGGHRRITSESVDKLLRSRKQGFLDSGHSSNPRILVVEDDTTVQAYYKALIQILRPDAELKIASDGYEGLVSLGQMLPHLMLLDVDMPGMDGIGLLKSVEGLDLPSTIVIAVVTALSEEELEKRGGVPARVPVYSKPLSTGDLESLLSKIHLNEEGDVP